MSKSKILEKFCKIVNAHAPTVLHRVTAATVCSNA